MAKAPKDPEMALAKQRVAASSPSMDTLIEKDPQQCAAPELLAGIEHARNERALWTLKQERKGRASEEKPKDEEEEDE